ncbi:sigma-54-dependent Fis family transcriptional regulator [Prauserella endophytica]|nr:helix-turn-helix domain-containing protein [Prauserella endophytica]
MSATHREARRTDAIRSAKESLLSRGLLHTDTRPEWLPAEIDRSWRRSLGAGAVWESSAFRYVNEFDLDSELNRAARPVLDRLMAMLQDMGTAIFLADKTGQIVARRVADHSERTRFDNACAAEGFDFSEEKIGTNGLGTPMQEGDAVFVRGPEHFNAALEDLACAGTAIRHPATGRLMGSLSLAAPADTAETMMLAMAREGARQITDNLTATVGRREMALGRSYQKYRSRGPVIVLNRDTVMTNVSGLSFLNVENHALLWEALIGQDWSRGSCELELDLQVLQAQVVGHRLDELDGEPAFAVEIVDRRHQTVSRARSQARSVEDRYVAGLHRAAARSNAPLSVTGPSGAGKLHVALTWLRSTGHPDPLVLDAGDLGHDPSWRRRAKDALASGGAVVLRRLEDLAESQVNAVKALAEVSTRAVEPRDHTETAQDGAEPRLIVTADPTRCSGPVLGVLACATPGAELPALAHREAELPVIIDALVGELPPHRRPLLSAPSMQVLRRWHWPGNVAELRSVVETLARERPGRYVSPADLPPRMQAAVNRRNLSRMAAAERAEIIAALRQAEGNKSRAAEALGIGRNTLYRKLHTLGIDDALLSEPDVPALR